MVNARLQGGWYFVACAYADDVDQCLAHAYSLSRDFGIALCYCGKDGLGEGGHMRLPNSWIALLKRHTQELKCLYPEL